MNRLIKEGNNALIKKISIILNDFENYDKPVLNDQGDIIIRNKKFKKAKKDNYILTNVFRQIIADDFKKNRVK